MHGRFLFTLAIGIFLVGPSAAFPDSPDKPSHGELRIEGRFVKTLTLQKLKADHSPATSQDSTAAFGGRSLLSDDPRETSWEKITLDNPGTCATLPAGQYRWVDVWLQDKGSPTFRAENYAIYYEGSYPIIIAPDKPAVLKIGGPLTSMLEVDHQGTNLQMNYRLAGVGGETYAASGHTLPPKYTIYKGDRLIATGSFEYG